ncbi:YkuS family protein [Clostridium sp. D2Q-14]|uniref:YkuS family protein n=1 Tax=Anaeromonas gelatinilytica TaxID=2683194 RepID=UPI00193B6DA3|nr:YkuS family protein [Anaeromonas gelatinilytica]MBS4534528.1 YkuS family protein [Anaeromonas gelatinilytica]
MKNILVQNGLNELAEELIRKGYNVVNYEEANNSDVYIYMADGHDISSLSNIMDMDTGESIENKKGTLLINANNKTIDQIEEILNRGYYTPLL